MSNLGFNIYNELPPNEYVTEHIYAMDFRDDSTTYLPLSSTLTWDICAVSKNTNTSLSALSVSSFSKLDDLYLKTVTWNDLSSNNILSGYLPYIPVYSITGLDSFGLCVFSVISGSTTYFKLSDDYNNIIIPSSYGYWENGYINYDTGYYEISTNVIGASSDNTFNLYVDYCVNNGDYILGTSVNALSSAGLTITQNDKTYMYRISTILDTTDVINTTAIEYFPLYPNNFDVELQYFNNYPEGRIVNLEIVNRYNGDKVAFAPWLTGYWDYTIPYGGGLTVLSDEIDTHKNDTTLYTGTFNSTTRQAVLSTFVYNVSVFNDTISTSGLIFNDNYSIVVDEYPDIESYNFKPLISNNDPKVIRNKLWKTITDNVVSASISLDIPGWYGYGGDLTIDWGDDTIDTITSYTSISSLSGVGSHTYILTAPTSFNIYASSEPVSAINWLSAHSISTELELQFVDRFLSGVFIAYPQYYFDLSGNYIELTQLNYTNSHGVCAYGEGSSVVINLSAWEPELGKNTKYQWGIGYSQISSVNPTYIDVISSSVGNRVDSYDFGDEYTYTPTGTAISLTVFNDDFPVDMYPWYTNSEGVVVKYPNFDVWSYAHTDANNNSNKLFQNVRVFNYEDFSYNLSPITTTVNSSGVVISSNINITKPDYSPVIIPEQTYVWVLSANGWSSAVSTTLNSTNYSYILIEGNGVTPGTLLKDSQVNITLSVSGNVSKDILYRDFNTSIDTISLDAISANIFGEFEPELRIFSNDLHAITGDTFYFQNLTTTSTTATQPSSYIWNFNNGDGTFTTSGSSNDLIAITYNEVGTYSVNLTSISNGGLVTTKNFNNIITIESYYPYYSDDVLRVYGSTGLELPYTYDDIKIKSNEFINDNINSSFDKINNNIEYIKSAANKYLEPPTKFYGWLGMSKYNETDISWHVTIPGINAQYNSLENIVDNNRDLNNILSVAEYNDKLYAITDTTLFVLSSDFNATEIDTRSYKTIGDIFYNLVALDINSQGQLYILDNTVQKVVVFDNYDNYGWKYLYSWGKYGGKTSFKGFKNPIDLYIDSNDNVWITDDENNVVKKYTNSGSWLMTLDNSILNNIKSTTIDDNGNIHVLMADKIAKFDGLGNFIKIYNVTPYNQIAKKIIFGKDGFIYVLYNKSIIKVTKDGKYAGVFGDTFNNISYNSIYNDVNRNLYITNSNSIVKYYDKTKIDTIISNNNNILSWNMSNIYINKNEYVQDWVYNRAFSKLWDNIEILKRSIIGSVYEVTDAQGKIKNTIVGFTPQQYNKLYNLSNKNDVFIGVNELVTADSINRCLKQLYDILDTIFNTITKKINSTTDSVDSGTDDITTDDLDSLNVGIGWRWIDTSSQGKNPFTYNQLSIYGSYPTKWQDAITKN